MLGQYFYNESLRKTIIAFGSMFNDIYVTRRNSAGTGVQTLKVPLAYGPKQDFNRFIPIIIKACIKNEKFPCSKGNQIRDYIHVEDVVGAIHKTLVSKNARGKIINIGSGKPRNLKSIIKYVKKATKGGHPQFDKIKLRKDEVLKIYPNINKAKLNIKWKPKILFKKGLEQTIRSYGKLR